MRDDSIRIEGSAGMPLNEDTAERVMALVTALGDVNAVDALGTIATATTVPDPASGSGHYVTATLGANITVTLPPPAQGKRFSLSLTQDATGSRLVTWATPSGAVRWPGAAAPTLTITAGHTDIIDFECYDGVNWVGTPHLNVG